ncbi:polyadenylate binding protein types 1 2 3 4 family protein [Aspergillus parasiticus SU-1]|uniref:Polyadenylate binding protein types 1 2 3 4 family protein n=1 Tax=Aspergillus parasiticus (strain ATCC 56775 / NRRL 5862 / SRRC 143 / SU-1) TaxID=1403190 RepID=A0A0F0IGN1_ASPPU|nr:polyadenylate binding protein types 1 2 3 4 family protein [Aspergillus parasiticus SU-1]
MSADEGGGTASIPATNGDLHATTPDPPSLATPAKRKRVSSHDDKVAQDAGSSASQAQEKIKLQETLRNLVEILSKNDTDLQLLSCPLPSSPTKPRSKRAKVSGEKDEASTIQSRVASNRYNTLSEFLSDIEKASAAVIERNKAQASGLQADGSPVTETVNRIAAFKKLLNSLVRQAHTSQSNIKAETSEEDAETPAKSNTSNVETRNENLVLTLFGNPANPKQLYSSLQKSVKVPLPSDDPKAEKYVEVQAPLREVGLPNGITTTKIEPYNLDENPAEPKRTFGEVFAPRSTLPQLEMPRKTKSSSRSALNGWIDPFEAITDFKAFRGDRNNYCLAPLPSGQWLQYGGVTSSPSYWNRRDKHQPSQQHSDEKYTDDPSLWVDEDSSVLQGVYSSFAPSFDSSGAVVQADSKDLVWWGKRGARRLETLLSLPYQEAAEETTSERPGNIGELDESTLEEMVKNFKPEEFADNVTCSEASKADKEEEEVKSRDVEGLLHDISDLLETLSSYQKIRNLDVSAPNVQGAEPRETGSDSRSSDDPSTEELGVYETLRSSLAALISNLPPYAVAKLNGDQLDELNISQKIVIENPDYRGTMEKDDFTAHQERSAAMAPMSGAANRTSTPSRYNSRAYSSGSRTQSQGGFAQQPYYSGRQPSTSGPYTPGHPQQYAGPRPPVTPSQRPGYLSGYSQPTPQFNQQFQRPGQNGYASYSAQQGPAAQASPQPYTPRPAQPGAYNASYAAGRSASPQKPASYAAPRTPYMTPGSNNPQQRLIPQQQQQQQPQQQPQPQPQQQQQQQQPPPYGNYPSNQAPPQSAAYSNSAAAMTYARSAAEQAALMERNRTQLAAHARQSSTPQPPNEGSSQDRSVTPGNRQNGNPVPS